MRGSVECENLHRALMMDSTEDDPFAPIPVEWQRKRSHEEIDQNGRVPHQNSPVQYFEGRLLDDPFSAEAHSPSQITPECDDGKTMPHSTPQIVGMHNLYRTRMGHEQTTPHQNEFPNDFGYYQSATGNWYSNSYHPYHQSKQPQKIDQVKQQAYSSVGPEYQGFSAAAEHFMFNSMDRASPVRPFPRAYPYQRRRADFPSPYFPYSTYPLPVQNIPQGISNDSNRISKGAAITSYLCEAGGRESAHTHSDSRFEEETDSEEEAIFPPRKKPKRHETSYDYGDCSDIMNEPLGSTETSMFHGDFTKVDRSLAMDKSLHTQDTARNVGTTFHAIAYLSVAHEGLCSPNVQVVFEPDKSFLTDYVFYILKQLRSCHMSEADRRCRGRKREKISTGYAGLQCIHCVNDENPRKFFWSSVDRLANSFTEISGHIFKCWRCPQQTKDALMKLKHLHPYQIAALPRGSQKIFFRQLWRRLHDGEEDKSNPESKSSTIARPASAVRSPSVQKSEATKMH